MEKNSFLLCLFTLIGLASCTDKESDIGVIYSYEETLGIYIDPAQTWHTSDAGIVTVSTPGEGVVSIYCEDTDKRTYLAKVNVSGGEKIIKFDIPQHLAQEEELYRLDENEEPYVYATESRDVMVDFKNAQTLESESKRLTMDDVLAGATVSFGQTRAIRAVATRAGESTTAVNEAPQKSDLTGETSVNIYGYSTFSGDVLKDLAKAIPEGKRAVNLIHDYEMISNGKFLVSMIYGCTGNADRVIGYYYYDENSPNSKTYVPFCDALKYDYFYNEASGYSKENAISKTQVKIGRQWYDVNYDHYDRLTPNKGTFRIAAHKGDQAYLVLDVFDRQKDQIEEVRGITFLVDAPKGKKLGFYTTGSNMGNKTNHSEEQFNSTSPGNNSYASVIRIYNDYRFIGIEDTTVPIPSSKSGEPDCNDICFVMVPGGNLPDIRLPYIIDKTEGEHNNKYYNGDGTWTAQPKKDILTDGSEIASSGIEESQEQMEAGCQTWTMGFEDRGTSGDYDMNDVVIQVTPIGSQNKAKVELCAVGAADDVELYYVNTLLGEVHDIMGIGQGKVVNVRLYSKTEKKLIAYVDWPDGKNMRENASDFYIMADGKKSTVPTDSGKKPTAICVSGEWSWPLEKIRITDAYPLFKNWAENSKDKTYWNWYASPVSDSVFVY